MVSKQGMLPPRLLPFFATLSTLPVTDSARVLGTLILGAPGAGKTIFESLCLLVDLLRGLPGCVLDPLGTLSEAFLFRLLWFLSEFPTGDDELLWQRLRYIELGGDYISPFPIYSKRHGESLWDTSERLITVLERANPQLVTGSPLTWPAARRLAVNAGMLLTALGYGGLTKIESLLFDPLEWEQSGRFDEAMKRNTQAKDAVSYFRNHYLLLPRPEQRRLTGTFLDQVFPLISDPTLQAVFSGSSTPGIDLEEVEANPQLVMINCKGITNPASNSFAMQWILESLLGHLKKRGRRKTPFVVMVDEFANLTAAGTVDNKPLAELFDELLAQYASNNMIFVTLALQSLDQVDTRLRQTLLRMGTIISSRAGTPREARALADVLFRKDINRVQHNRKVFGKVDPPPFIRGLGYRPAESLSLDKQLSPYYPYYILEVDPQYMGLQLQEEEAAGKIQALGTLEFLCRAREGTVSEDVLSFSIADALRDPETGEWQFPDPDQDGALIAKAQQELAARSGIPLTDILKEQEARLNADTSQTPQRTRTVPDGRHPDVQPSTLPARAQPNPHHVKTNPSLPTLNEQEQALLSFLIEHPDLPVSGVYKGLGISVRKGTEIRDTLKEQGFLVELELRTGTTGAGRPMKWVMPSFQAFEFFGIDPPRGRGSIIHRQLQQLVAAGAHAKAYKTELEKVLDNGAIVDVHLEKDGDGERIAVEIAIASKSDLEIAHIRNCLLAGYDQIYCLFLDENLLARTKRAVQGMLSAEESEKVRLLPLRLLSHLG
jgi:hypothetical protein